MGAWERQFVREWIEDWGPYLRRIFGPDQCWWRFTCEPMDYAGSPDWYGRGL